MTDAQNDYGEARTRSLLWMQMFLEGANTTAGEENRKEEVLWVFRKLASDSKREEVREYVPWEPWWR